MRDLKHLDQYRRELYGFVGDNKNGNFKLELKIGQRTEKYTIIASDGGDWEHVSISMKHRTPTWEEMCYFKDLFFEEWEDVIQFHPKKEDYVNNHNFCLHLWRPANERMPMPPKYMV